MKRAWLFAMASWILACGCAVAQPATKMYPGTDFPGNDLGQISSPSPQDCASRCMAESRCTAFTFNIPAQVCYLKWSVSHFDGSVHAVSGVIEGRPSGGAGANQGYYPPPATAMPGGRPPSCSANGNSVCAGCSITCAVGQQASCREGEVHDTTCWTASKCECRGFSQPPASVYTPNTQQGTNSCSTPDRSACRGCSATCAQNEKAICSPSIPGDQGTCHMQAFCRCQQK